MEAEGDHDRREPSPDELVEWLTRPMDADLEHQIHFRSRIMDQVLHARPLPGDDGLKEALATLRRPQKITRGRQLMILVSVMLVLLGIGLVAIWREIPGYFLPYYGTSVVVPFGQDLRARHAFEELESSTPFRLVTPSSRQWALHEPWRYAVYRRSLVDRGREPDSEVLALQDTIDPGNGLWPLLEIDNEARKRGPVSGSWLDGKLEEFLAAPRLDLFRPEIVQARRAGFRPPQSSTEAVAVFVRDAGLRLKVVDTIFARVQDLEAAGNQGELARYLALARRAVLRMMIAGPESLQGDYGQIEAEDFARVLDAAGKAGLGEEALRWADLVRVMEQKEAEEPKPENFAMLWQSYHSGFPIRQANVVLVSRMLVLSMAVGVFLAAVGVTILAWWNPFSSLGQITDHLGRLITPGATLRMVTRGVVLPVVWCCLWGTQIRVPDSLLPVGVFYLIGGSSVLMILAWSFWAAEREVARRTSVAGFTRSRFPALIAWVAAVPPVLLGLDYWSMLERFGSWNGELLSYAGVVEVGVIVLLVGFWIFSHRRWDTKVRTLLGARLIVPLLLVASSLGLAAVPVLRAVERKLVSGPVDKLYLPPEGDLWRQRYDAALKELQDRWAGS